MTLKVACAILAGGATACALLGARQARIQAAHELAASKFRQQIVGEDVGRLRAVIAERVAQASLHGAGDAWPTTFGPPVELEAPRPDAAGTDAPSATPSGPAGSVDAIDPAAPHHGPAPETPEDEAWNGGVAPASGVGDGRP